MQVNGWARKPASVVLNEQRCQLDWLRQRQITIADIGVAPIGSDRSVTDHLRLLRHRVRSHRCRHDGIVENDACTTGQRSKAGRVIRLVDVFVDGLRLPTGSNGRRAAEP